MTKKPNAVRRAWDAVRSHKWLTITIVWGVVITALAFVTPTDTVREQSPAIESLADIDAAMGDAAGLLAGEPYGYAITPLKTGEACDITPVRAGEQFSRTLSVYAEPTELEKIAKRLGDALESRYGLSRTSLDGQPPSYRGELHSFTQFSLMTSDTEVTWRAETGCRPPGDDVGRVSAAFDTPDSISAVLSQLGVESARWRQSHVECGDLGGPGGRASSIEATGKIPNGRSLGELDEAFGEEATLVVANDSVVAYRDGATNWSVAVRGATITVASTADCAEKDLGPRHFHACRGLC